MLNLNYSNLDPTEFEALAMDVMSRILGTKLYRFGEGKDQGIDLTDDSVKHNIVVQCKRYRNSSNLIHRLVIESSSLETMNPPPKRYFIFTSAILSAEQMEALLDIFSEYMESEYHIIHAPKIEAFFNDPSNLDIMKKHPKLFISYPDWYISGRVNNTENQLLVSGLFTKSPITGPVIGRERLIANIEKKLFDDKGILLLNGVGGIGKTTLAKKIYWDLSNKYDCVGWIDYNKTFANSLSMSMDESLFPDQDFSTRYNSISNYFANDEQSKLFIIDNVSNDFYEDASLNDLRTWPNTTVLLTSRRDKMEGIDSFEINCLDEDEAFTLFSNYYSDDTEEINNNADTIHRLLSWAKYHTLTIEIIAKAAEFEDSLVEFCEKLYSKQSDAINLRIETLHSNKRYTIENHLKYLFDISSIRNIQEQYRIMWCFAIMPVMEIPREIIDWLSIQKHDLQNLIQLGWVEKHNKSYYMHELIREVLLQEENVPVNLAEPLFQYICNEDNHFFDDEDPYQKKRIRYDIATAFTKYVTLSKNERDCSLLLSLMLISLSLGEYKDSEKFVFQLDNLIGNDPDYIEYKILLNYQVAMIYDINGQEKKAFHYLNSALDLLNAENDGKNASDDISFLKSDILYRLSSITSRSNNFEEAQKYMRLAKELSDHNTFSSFEENNFNYYETQGVLLLKEGKYDESELMFRKALNQLLPQDTIKCAVIYNSLGEVYRRKQEYELAKENYLKALDLLESNQQNDLAQISAICNNLGLIYLELGNYQASEQYFIRSMKITNNSPDPINLNIATVYNSLGQLYRTKGDFKAAEKNYNKCIEILNSLDMQDSIEMSAIFNNYANLYATIGNVDKALDYFTYSVEINEHILGNCHPDLLMPYLNLSWLLIDLADYKKADLYLQKVSVLIEKYSYYDTTFAAVFHLHLGKYYLCQKQYVDAESHLEEALRLSQKHFGKIHNITASVFELLSELSKEKGQYQKAIDYGKETLSIHQLLFDEDNDYDKDNDYDDAN